MLSTNPSSKGQLGFEIMFIVLALFIVGLGLVLANGTFKDLNDDIQGDEAIGAEAKATSDAVVDNFSTNWDNLMLFFFVLVWAFLLIASFFADTHPIFLIFTIILLLIGLTVTMYLSNAYSEVTSDGDVSAFAADFPKMNWIMNHLLTLMIVVGLSCALVLYGRTR